MIDNSGAVSTALEAAIARAAEIIGGKAEGYAKALCPVDTGNLRNSITHTAENSRVTIGSAVQYAPYVELGTGKEFKPPPEWVQNSAPHGAGLRKGQKPQPYLRPAILEHKDEYKAILLNELKNA